MKKTLTILLIAIICSQFLHSEWSYKERLIGRMIGHCTFTNEKFGFLTENGSFYQIPKFYLTEDGGKTWLQTLKYHEIFLDTNEYNGLFKPTASSYSKDGTVYLLNKENEVLKSIDFGKNWNRFIPTFTSIVPVTNSFKLKMYNGERGFIVTDYKIFITTDSCKTFSEFPANLNIDKIGYYDITITNDSIYSLFIYDFDSKKNKNLLTLDSGNNWIDITDNLYNRPAIVIDESNRHWKAYPSINNDTTYNDNILCSNDFGKTWINKFSYPLGKKLSNNITQMNFISKNLGIAYGGLNKLFITNDGGNNWADLSVPNVIFNSVHNITAAFRISENKSVAINWMSDIYNFDNSIGVNDHFIQEDIRVFPNPCTDKLIIDYGFDKPKEIYLYDLLGNIVINTNDNYINTSGLTTGTYLLKLKYDSYFKTFMIQKR